MKDPQFGSNRIQSFIDFQTTEGRLRFGKEGSRIFIQWGEVKTYLTDTTGVIGLPSLILTDQIFAGVVDLSRLCTHYTAYTVASNITLSILAGPAILGSAIVRMIGNGTHSPVFTAFKKLEGSQDYDSILNAVNIVEFAFDGVDYWYNIDKEAV